MKMMKIALIGSAALAAASLSARADELSDLKAQIEALNSRMATLESQPTVPAGYQLLTVSEGKAIVVPGLEETDKLMGTDATVISVLPTADAPAATEVTVTGYVRAGLQYHGQPGPDDIDIYTRGQVVVTGKTDTAVGEVGAKISMRANAEGLGDPTVISNEHWGWWAMTPELTLGGGYTGTLGNIGYGYDGACNCYLTDNADVAFNPGDTTQMRLSYASGPISFAVALEDATGDYTFDDDGVITGGSAFGGDGNALGAAAELKFSGDVFNGEISGVWREGGPDVLVVADDPLTPAVDESVTASWDDSYQIGIGLGMSLDMVNLSMGAAMGHIVNGQDYWGISALASANLSDAVHAEIAVGHKNYDNGANFLAKNDVTAVLAGIYYDPVSQLTIGLEAEYVDPKGGDNETYIDLVTVYRF